MIREGEYIGIFPHKFKEIIKRSEFDSSSIIKSFKERSWIQTASGQNTYPLWFRSKKIRMIKILWNAFKHLWE